MKYSSLLNTKLKQDLV